MRANSLAMKMVVAALVVVLAGAAFVRPAQAQSVCGSAYTVQWGDWLGKIAQMCGVDYQALLAANPQVVYPYTIYAGQVLTMPGATPAQAAPTVSIDRASGYPGGVIYVTGSGFPGNTTLQLGPAPAGTSNVVNAKAVTTIGSGVFVSSVQVPTDATAGSQWVVRAFIEGASTEAVSTPFNVVDPPGPNQKLSIAPTTGPAGAGVMATGTGWPANTALRVGPARLAGGDMVSDAQANTDANGNFSAAVTIPADGYPGETWVVRAMVPGGGYSQDSNVFTVALPINRTASVYIARSGDTLSSIAKKFGLLASRLAAANPALPASAALTPGTPVYIPYGWNTHDPYNPYHPYPGGSTNPLYHAVLPGETLNIIAVNYGTSWPVLMRLNPQIQDPNRIYYGQVIRVQ